ncbi:MAG TPA: molybdopterin-dependent oxidoreductase, partial [Enterovirga sp.]
NRTTDRGYIESHTTGFREALEQARAIAPDLAATARGTGLAEADVAAFFDLFQTTERAVTLYSQGVNQSAQGTDKVNAIINCHLATGRIGRPGMGPFSLTGQPNAMGGREVGGLANMLAAHMGFTGPEVDRVRRFWKAPRIVHHEGLKAVGIFDAIKTGRIKALWIMATNPAVSMPDADGAREALDKLDLLVVSENVLPADTITAKAHILLPAAAWGEKDGTVTNSERRITRQRPFLRLPGEAKPDWWIVSEVGRRMGFAEAFPYRSAADIFREHAALSAFENDGARDFDLSGLSELDTQGYNAMPPVQWPLPRAATEGRPRLFATGGFFTPDRKARFIAPERPSLASPISEGFPFRLNTGRVRDQWHTMTRTGKSPRLGSHTPAPFVEIHPEDAARSGLQSGDLARVTTGLGEAVLEVVVSEGQQPGSLFAPIHWSCETSSSGRVGALAQPIVDPFSGQPELKATPAQITAAPVRLRGFVLSRKAAALPAGTWWAKVALTGGTGTLFATELSSREVAGWAPVLFPEAELAEYADAAADIYRCAAFADGKLEGAIFVAPVAARPHWDAVKSLFAGEDAATSPRLALSGLATDGLDSGPLICACFGVGLRTIQDAILSQGATTPEAIGAALRAGTNCGSCVPELRKIIGRELATQAG